MLEVEGGLVPGAKLIVNECAAGGGEEVNQSSDMNGWGGEEDASPREILKNTGKL